MNVLLYGRVSGRVQDKTETIETQVTVMEAYCRKHGFEIGGHYLDKNVRSIVSFQERKEGGRLLRDLEKGGVDLVLVYAIDRLSRYREVSDPVLRILKERDIAFDSATEDLNVATKEGKMMYAVKMVFAELERDTLEQRMRDGRHEWAAKTWTHTDGEEYSYWQGGLAPYGYMVLEVNKRRALIPNEERMACGMSEADVVRRIYRWSSEEGLSLALIAERLTQLGVPTHSKLTGKGRRDDQGGRDCWYTSSVGVILRRPVYKGEDSYAGINQKVPAIVPLLLWNRTQTRLKDRRKFSDRNSSTIYLLRGKIRCACGYGFTGAPWYRGYKRVEGLHRYVCCAKQAPELLHRPRCSASPRLHGPDVDALVWGDVLWVITHPEESLERLRVSLQGSDTEESSLTKERDDLLRQAEKKRTALRNLVTMRAEGEITREQYLASKGTYEETLAALETRARELDASIQNTEAMRKKLHTAESLLADLKDEAERGEWTAERKNELVRELVDRVEVSHEEINVYLIFDREWEGASINPWKAVQAFIILRHLTTAP